MSNRDKLKQAAAAYLFRTAGGAPPAQRKMPSDAAQQLAQFLVGGNDHDADAVARAEWAAALEAHGAAKPTAPPHDSVPSDDMQRAVDAAVRVALAKHGITEDGGE